jgi:NodT family efflux transporter outer membrane factor (OMF) lipoprotein
MKEIVKITIAIIVTSHLLLSCKTPNNVPNFDNKNTPQTYGNNLDTTNIAKLKWKQYFSDSILIALIDTALKNNQELNIMMQEIEISKYEIGYRKGEYLPFLGIKGLSGFEKEGRYTRYGAVDDNIEIKPGTKFPEPLPNFFIAGVASWEIDVWRKLRNAKKSAVANYLSKIEGKNFMATNLVAEIACAYYQLIGLDNLLDIIDKNIQIQKDALETVKQQKDAAKVSQLAVNRFAAQLLNTINLQFEVQQKIIETENHLNYLAGRYPQPIKRIRENFFNKSEDSLYVGVPSQLLLYRPDIRQSELQLIASKLDVKTARANFYPSFKIDAAAGFNAFNPAFILYPQSILYNLGGELIAPLLNRSAIKAAYLTANAKQIQAIYSYQQTILGAYVEVANQLNKNKIILKSYDIKLQEVEVLTQSINISNSLFKSARSDYIEVLLTQKEVLQSKMELVEIKMEQLNAKVNLYRALGGGWR